MEFSAKTIDVVKRASPCLVLGVHKADPPVLARSGQRIDQASQNELGRLLSLGDFDATVGSTQMLYRLSGIKSQRVLLVGLGTPDDFTPSVVRRAAKSAAMTLNRLSVEAAHFTLLDSCSDKRIYRFGRSVIEGIGEALYRYDETLSEKRPVRLNRVTLVVTRSRLDQAQAAVRHGQALVNGIGLTKTLSNLPGNICTPGYLAREAQKLQQSHPIKTTVLDEAAMKRKKMGALLSVSRGSREPAKLIVMEYHGGNQGDPPVALVGKGLTFDAGGISIKPAAAMDEMKFDMCGGASVFGVIRAIAEMELRLNVVGIIPSSENLPDGAANKPGDIVTSMSGTTIEILNTDAEGRLILCDALTYTEKFNPACVIDIATLTGACVIALGAHASGLFSNCDALAEELFRAGEASGDRAWKLPVWESYTRQLKSNFADLANIGGKGAGAVTAACFLKHFAGQFDWAHLDIAGTAWHSGSDKGATGRPVSLLVEFLLGRSGEPLHD